MPGTDSIDRKDASGQHFAFRPADELALDLADPEQRDFGDYELLEAIGQGGMGVVYRARQRSLDRDVALKLLSAGPWASADFIARFRHEAQSAARLQHPNIVPIYEIGQHAELNFFSMALVRGESLAERIDRDGRMPARHAARLLRVVADALDYAHRFGILHLDLKPANVLIDEHGEPQVADFGLSKRLDESLTSGPGEVSGTPSYMAPEQAAGDTSRIGVATDIYGLGAVLFELLAGRPPFAGATSSETLQRVIGQDVEPLRDVPADIDAICRHCLEKDPARRYPSAHALSEDLARFLDGRPVSVRPWRSRERLARWARREPRLALAVAAVAVVLVVGLASTTVQWRRAERATARAEAAARDARATLWENRVDDAEVALRDGAGVTVLPGLLSNLTEQEASGAREDAALTRVRMASVLAETPVLVDTIATGHYIQRTLVDARGEWVAVSDGGGRRVHLYDLGSGARRWELTLGENDGDQVLPSTNPRYLFVDQNNAALPMWRAISMVLVDIERGVVIQPPDEPSGTMYRQHYSPDGEHAILVVQEATGVPRGRLVRVSDWSTLGVVRDLPGRVLMAPAGDAFAYRETMMDDGDRPTAIEFTDARTMRVRWRYEPLGTATRSWAFSPSGHELVIGHADGSVVVLDAASGAKSTLPSAATASAFDIVYGAAGQWIAVAHADGTVQAWDAATRKVVAAPLRPRGNDLAAASIALDEAGRRIMTSRSQSAEVFSLPREGLPTRLFSVPRTADRSGSISTDANMPLGLYAVGGSDGELRIWRQRARIPLDATAPLRLHRDAVRRFDGERVMHVDGNTAQWRSIDPGRASGAAMVFEQAVGFTEVVPGRGAILVNVGRTLYLRDGMTGRDVFPPNALPGTPAGVFVAPDGGGYLAAWNVFDGASGLAIRRFDTATGAATAEVRLDHPSYELSIGDDGGTLLAKHLGKLHAFDARTLSARWGPRAFGTREQPTPIRGMRIGRDGKVLWLVSGVGGLDGYRLHALDVVDGAELEQWRLPGWARALQPFDDGRAVAVLLSTQDAMRLYRRGGKLQSIALPELDGGHANGFALSEDERRLAVSLRSGIQWFELPTGRWLSPPFEPLALDASFGSLAVSAKGDVAIMSDTQRRYWRFDLFADARDVGDLARVVEQLSPDPELREAFAEPASPALRAQWRAQDPGAPQVLQGPVAKSQAVDDAPLADERFVDLRPHCNLRLDDTARQMPLQPHFARMIDLGTQRFVGVDFDVRCGVYARYPSRGRASVETGSRFEGIRIAHVHAAGLELLMAGSSPLLERPREPYASIEWRYRDGTTARSPVVFVKDIEPWFWYDSGGSPERPRVAYTALGLQQNLLSGAPWLSPPSLYAVKIDNPMPSKAVESFAFESTTEPWSGPVLLAATVVPRESSSPL